MDRDGGELGGLGRIERLEAEMSQMTDVIEDVKVTVESGMSEMKDQLRALVSYLDSRLGTSPGSTAIPPASAVFESRIKPPKERRDARVSTFEDLLENSTLPAPTVVVERKEFEGKHLETLSIGEVIRFCDEVDKFEAHHGTALKVGTLFSEDAKLRLVSKSDGRLTHRRFYTYSRSTIFEELKRAMRPRSPEALLEVLDRNVGFPLLASWTPNRGNGEDLFDAILMYKEKFLFVYHFLADDNAENVPGVHNREGGIMRLFAKKIPHEYGKNTVKRLLEKKRKQEYDVLELFLEDFVAECESTRDLAIRSNNEMLRFTKPKFEDNIDKRPERKSFNQDRRFSNAPVRNLNTLELLEDEQIEDNPEASLNFLKKDKPEADSKAKTGCYKKIYFKECKDPRCGFAHDALTLEVTHGKLQELLDKSPFKPKPKGAVHLLKAEDSETESDQDSVCARQAHENLFFLSPLLENKTSAYVGCNIMLRDGGVITVPEGQVLLDSGASRASYMSMRFFEEHEDILRKYLKSGRHSVTIGNGTVTQSIGCVELCLQFAGEVDEKIDIECDIYVIDGLPPTIVIGWEDLTSKLGWFYIKLVEKAVLEREGGQGQLRFLEPWKETTPEEAPEENLVPEPCAFPTALAFLEMGIKEATKEFLGQIDTHVSSEFLSATSVRKVLEDFVDVFVPTSWDGIKGVEPLEFKWKIELPERIKPQARHINPRIFKQAESEFRRLKGYFYEDSDSPIASCLVVAPKATKPFIRFCGDYTKVNHFVETGHYPIPVVKQELGKIISFPIYLDIDLANSYHQFRLGPVTARRLSIQTPWGQVQPRFLPEGVSPASGVLQKAMYSIFEEFKEFSICIFDNLLILAISYVDALDKLRLVLAKCREYNIVLKFSKTWLGFTKVDFFGYECCHKSFGLSKKRKDAIKAFEMPTSQKKMQSFLGTANFFHDFVPNFSTHAADMHGMTQKDFNWDPQTWTKDYAGAFERFKDAIVEACTLFYPDYSLDWFVRSDASELGVGAVLLQVFIDESGSPVQQPIAFASQKFSEQARRWSTYEQEAYGIFFAVHSFEYFLVCKTFVVETDHRNLQWIENSPIPKVIRWKIYLSRFNFQIRHISGKSNTVADWQSRFFLLQEIGSVPGDVRGMLAAVHGGRSGHHGSRKTWELLNKHFPGHRVPISVVAEFVSTCPVCQKDRIGMLPADILNGVTRHLKVPHARHTVGVDTLTITPTDLLGRQYLIVIVNQFTKFVALYPAEDKTAITLARCLIQFFCAFGKFNRIISDPGSDLMSDVIKNLNKWIGIQHIFSLVDRHESNGVERTNGLILRHLRALVYDERIGSTWSAPEVLCWVAFELNSFPHGETGITPYEATFGSDDVVYFNFKDDSEVSHPFVKHLSQNLKTIRENSFKFQQKLIAERSKNFVQTVFKPGDFVLHQRAGRQNKLQPQFQGPFEVLSHHKNDVKVRNLVRGNISELHVSKLKIFHGTKAEALEMANLDNDEFVIDVLLGYKGDPLERTSMDFLVRFADKSELWLPWSRDLSDTVQFEHFCNTHSELRVLLMPSTKVQKYLSGIIREPITEINIGDVVYVDLRTYQSAWYDSLSLPDKYTHQYVLKYNYVRFKLNNTQVLMHCIVFNEYFWVKRDFVLRYGLVRNVPESATLITKEFADAHPEIKPSVHVLRMRNFEPFAKPLKVNIEA